MSWGSGGSKSRLLHATVARSTFSNQKVLKTNGLGALLEVETSKKSTPLWREAHFQVKSVKTWRSRSTFGSWDVEKVHAKRISKSKCTKHTSFGALLEVEMFKKCTPLWREAHFKVKSVQMSFCVAGARDYAPCQKWAKREGFVACPKTMAGVGHMQKIWQDVFRLAGAVQETCSSEMLGGQGADFLRGVAFWSIRSSSLLRWFCVTGAALRMTWHHFFVPGAVL